MAAENADYGARASTINHTSTTLAAENAEQRREYDVNPKSNSILVILV